ncbi:MAG: NADH:ubiquinone oxidoreductase [Thermoplasmata archaeon]|nr:NADH:ubiquinone oxidoreductase [Candidatus Sysuiplasma acidicola]
MASKFPASKPESVSPWSTRPVRIREGTVTCPVDAISGDSVTMEKCISCGRCSDAFSPEGSVSTSTSRISEPRFRRSFNLFMIDTGSCGACNLEVKALSNPMHDMQRLGIFFTGTPRHADALLVVGVLSDEMKEALRLAYDAMPHPKLVFAIGACAISGGILGKGIGEVLQADVIVPGCPPSPFTILDALIKSKGSTK